MNTNTLEKIEELNKIPTYQFKIKEDTFWTIEVPTSMYQNKVADAWNNFNKYPEMSDATNSKNLNAQYEERLKQLGVYHISMSKNIFDTKFESDAYNVSPFSIISEDRKNKTSMLLELKKQDPFVGVFWLVDKTTRQICELDWLAVPNRKMASNKDENFKVFSIGIYTIAEESFLAIFKHFDNGISLYQYLSLGDNDVFYDEDQTFAPQRLIEVVQILPENMIGNLMEAWDIFHVNRYKYFLGEHPYQDTLDPIEITSQDKTRMFLIWLNRLQEL